jgi:hypothetical protein
MSQKVWIYLSLAALGVSFYLYWNATQKGTAAAVGNPGGSASTAALLAEPGGFATSVVGSSEGSTYINQLVSGGSTPAQIAAILGD